MDSAESSSKRRRLEEQDDQSPDVVKTPDYKLPAVLKNHFVYVGTVGNGSSRRTVLKCCHCDSQLRARANEVFPFRRHLNGAHEISLEKTPPSVPPSILEHFSIPKKPTCKTPAPKWLRQAVVDLVAVDGLPFSVMEGTGFQNFVAKLNPTVSCYSSRTIARYLDEDFEKTVLPNLTKHLQDLPPKSIHVTLDMWSSRSKDSILGLNVSYISPNWKINRRCLAFEQFPENHTGRNIELRVRKILERRKIKCQQVGKVMADNASNMIAAFNLTTILRGGWKPHPTPAEDDDTSSEEDDTEEDITLDEEPDVSVFSWERLGCCAHSLQLCVQTAIKMDASAKHVIEQVNQVILFFRRSNQLVNQLKEKTKSNRGLLLPNRTRWNSVFHAMKRLLKIDVFEAVLEIIRSTPSTSQRAKPSFPESIKPQLEELQELLEPIDVATNRLQGNGVTSSLVIPSLLESFMEIKKVKCNFFPVLRDVLLEQLKKRFQPAFLEPTYVVSAILDPRMKSRIFKASVSPEFSPMSEDCALQLMNEIFDNARTDDPQQPTSEVEVEVLEPSKKKSPKDLFAFLDSVAPIRAAEKTELELYLDEAVSSKNIDPLQFWKENSTRFPVLSGIAQIFLGVPASSGDVERLFSIAGSIQRARRSSIKPQRLEKMLLYRDYRKPILNHDMTT